MGDGHSATPFLVAIIPTCPHLRNQDPDIYRWWRGERERRRWGKRLGTSGGRGGLGDEEDSPLSIFLSIITTSERWKRQGQPCLRSIGVLTAPDCLCSITPLWRSRKWRIFLPASSCLDRGRNLPPSRWHVGRAGSCWMPPPSLLGVSGR